MSDYEESVGDDDTVSVNEEELNESTFVASKKPLINKKTIVPTIDNYNDGDGDGDGDEDEDEDIDEEEDDEDDDEIIDDDEQDYDTVPNDGFKKGGAKAAGDESDYEEQLDPDELDPENITKMSSGTFNKKSATEADVSMDEDSDDDEDENYNENYLQKFDSEIAKNYVNEYHPECYHHNYDEIAKSSIVLRNEHNIIIDPLHKTIPYLTKYEKARVLGQRAKQIEYGSKPYVKVPENVIEPHIIAELELKHKKLPFIIKRPLPNGSCEYWKLSDLEMIAF
uniref:DNA-directed RNA polymerase n=1 Tax=viral metagenome TaxID=1070528 RepID=A0A6C0LKE9_9ZZZZ